MVNQIQRIALDLSQTMSGIRGPSFFAFPNGIHIEVRYRLKKDRKKKTPKHFLQQTIDFLRFRLHCLPFALFQLPSSPSENICISFTSLPPFKELVAKYILPQSTPKRKKHHQHLTLHPFTAIFSHVSAILKISMGVGDLPLDNELFGNRHDDSASGHG